MKRTATSLLSIALLGVVMLGCSDDDATTSSRDLDGGSGTGDSFDAMVASLTDAQIAGVVATVNMGEIEAGNFATTKAQSNAAKEYASMMVTMHTAAQSDQATLLRTLGLTSADSSLSEMLKTTASTMLQQLMATPAGPGFDFAYVSGQATMHQSVLDLIDSQLLPQVDSASLKVGLQTTRALVKSHLDAARALLSTLQPDAG